MFSGPTGTDPETGLPYEKGSATSENAISETFQVWYTLVPETISSILPTERGLFIGDEWAGLYFLPASELEKNPDEVTFIHFGANEKNSLANNRVRDLAADGTGGVWIGTEFGLTHLTFDHDDQPIFRNYFTQDGLLGDEIQCLLADGQGGIWIGTYAEDGLTYATIDADGELTVTHYLPEDGLPRRDITALARDDGTGLWIGTRGGTVSHLIVNSGTYGFVNYAEDKMLPVGKVTALRSDSTGGAWIGYEGHGLIHLLTTKGGLALPIQYPEFRRKDVMGLVSDDIRDHLWVSSHMGLSYVKLLGDREIEVTTYGETKGLPHSRILSTAFDQTGKLWVGTYRGLSRASLGQDDVPNFVTYERLEGLPSNYAVRLVAGTSNDLWIGHFGAGVTRLVFDEHGDPQFQNTSLESDLFYGRNHTMVPDTEGGVWVGNGNAVQNIRINQAGEIVSRVIRKDDGYPILGVKGVFAPNRNELFVGSLRGLVRFRFDALGEIVDFEHYLENDGLRSNTIRKMVSDGAGGFWLQSGGGYSHVSRNQNRTLSFRNYDGEPGFVPGENHAMIYSNSPNELWAGSSVGLYRMVVDNQGAVISTNHYPLYELGGRRRVYAIQSHPVDGLWLGTNSGLLHFSFAGDEDHPEIQRYSLEDGLPDLEVRSLAVTDYDGLFVGTVGGLAYFVE